MTPDEWEQSFKDAGLTDENGMAIEHPYGHMGYGPESAILTTHEIWVMHPIAEVPGMVQLIIQLIGEGRLQYRLIKKHHVFRSEDVSALAQLLVKVLPCSLHKESRLAKAISAAPNQPIDAADLAVKVRQLISA